MNRKLMKMSLILGIVLVGVISFLGISHAQSQSSIKKRQTVKVNKGIVLTESWQKKTYIRVLNMESSDTINIRPVKEAKINVKILSLGEQEVVIDAKKWHLPSNGAFIPEDFLEISEGEILFVRPQVDGKILIDIELPESSQIDFFFNNEQVINNTSIYSPIAVKDGKVKKGETNLARAVAGLRYPHLMERSADKEVEISENGFVPFSKLQIKRSETLPDKITAIKAIIEINERGLVEKVNVLEPLNSSEVNQSIRQWKFVPYKKDGVAIKVKTIFIKE